MRRWPSDCDARWMAWARAICSGASPASRRSGLGPGGFGGLAADDVQADPEAQLAAAVLGPDPDGIELVGHRLERLAPGEVHVGMFGGDVECRRRAPAEVDVRPRGCGHDRRAVDPEMAALVGDGLTRPEEAEDGQEVGGALVAALLVEVVAVTTLLHVVAAGHDIEQQPTARDALVGRRRLGRQRRSLQSGAEGDEIFEALGPLGERSREDPGVLAPTARRREGAGEAEALGGAGHHPDVIEVGWTGRAKLGDPAAALTDGVAEAQVGAGVAVGR
jgi:hypothetical protein